LPSPCFELLFILSHITAELNKKAVSLILQLLLNRFLAEKSLPPLELSQKLRWSKLLWEYLLSKLLADLFLHWLQDPLILILSLDPVLCLILIRVEGINLSEWVEGAIDIEPLLLFWRQKSDELVMLRTKLKDFVDSNDHIVKV